jgi:hypothetical protein
MFLQYRRTETSESQNSSKSRTRGMNISLKFDFRRNFRLCISSLDVRWYRTKNYSGVKSQRRFIPVKPNLPPFVAQCQHIQHETHKNGFKNNLMYKEIFNYPFFENSNRHMNEGLTLLVLIARPISENR